MAFRRKHSRKLSIPFAVIAVLAGYAFIIFSMLKVFNILPIEAIKDKMKNKNQNKTNEKQLEETANLSSEATTIKFSLSESTIVLELAAFLRGLRRAMERKQKGLGGRAKNW